MNTVTQTDAHTPYEVIARSDRRSSPRSMTVYRVVKIERDGSEGLARCRNISDSGMKLNLNMPISLMDTLQIELAPGIDVSARVVWTNGKQCGVAFARNIDCTELLSRSAHEKRLSKFPGPLDNNITARLLAEGRTQPTTIDNTAQRGMLVTHDGKFSPGLHVKVLLADGTEKSAIVQWTEDNFAGLFLFDHFSVMDLRDLRSIGHITVEA